MYDKTEPDRIFERATDAEIEFNGGMAVPYAYHEGGDNFLLNIDIDR